MTTRTPAVARRPRVGLIEVAVAAVAADGADGADRVAEAPRGTA